MRDQLRASCRVLGPRQRKTGSCPRASKNSPFLPSVQSAYEQGFRRMIIDPNYTGTEVLLEFGEDVLFIAGTYRGDVDSLFMSTMRGGGIQKESDLLPLIIALLGVKPIPTKRGEVFASDLFVGREFTPSSPMNFEEIEDYLQENRV